MKPIIALKLAFIIGLPAAGFIIHPAAGLLAVACVLYGLTGPKKA